MLKGFITAVLAFAAFGVATLWASGFRDSDFLEVKSRESRRQVVVDEPDSRRSRRQRRIETERKDTPIKMKDGGVFDVGKVTNYKVLRDDQVIELRNPRSGRLEITVVKAEALPEEDLNRYDLEYSVMELDELSIQVDKHDEKPKEVKVDWEGNIRYPLIGEVQVGGLTLEQIKVKLMDEFRDYVKDPSIEVKVVKKSPLARVLVIGKGFQEFQGHEKVLDILGADYETTWENVYDKVCVIRKKEDGSLLCIYVDMEHMFKRYDFRQNIPLKAGDVILVKKMPPLFGYRFKFWWQQVLGWMNEVDEALNALKSIVDWRLKD
jgi:polysaccharide export outer membrane protein